jgi:glycerol-3-phosphate dehydrogenase (NAD(P)+)
VLHGDITPAEALQRLLAREQKAEYPAGLFAVRDGLASGQ